MNEKWMINRIGLVDFWYYDDQEFSFVNGRMLLRGANGSGKSVTMQSVVPLLLDGNIRPERLDPFGSRDRKMSGYLLEEGDGREERIGYLYMELIKPEKKLYHTIGMGLRAKRGKAVESWYFYISDGRRVNRDFYLYKEMDGKITLTQKELTNRIGMGGRVFSSQLEYMEHVNKQFFGFETVDEYKEMIDLLIQLRTPKLSKDFKPSVINEILSDSLQPLSEEDLRPMSEAIENMDNLSTSLSNKINSLQAAEKINRQYEKYNRCILRDKIRQYIAQDEKKRQLEIKLEQAGTEKVRQEKEISRMQELRAKLDQEREVREQEKENLNASDAVQLKQREADVSARLEESRAAAREKEKQLQSKKDRWKEYEIRFQKADEGAQIGKDKLEDILTQMEDGLEIIFQDEHAFFAEDFRSHMDQEIHFEAHRAQLKKMSETAEEGRKLLQDVEREKKVREELIQKCDKEKEQRSGIERRIAQAEKAFAEAAEEKREQIYQWNSSNKELVLVREDMQAIDRFFENYSMQSDYQSVKNIVSGAYYSCKNELETEKMKGQSRIDAQKDQIRKITEELQQWEQKEDPEPEISEAVRRNREKLMKLGIPFHRFYETVEFDSGLNEQQKNHLEEALLQMGILDALLIDRSYKEQVLVMDAGQCDKYIFTDREYQRSNLSDLLTVSDDLNDIFGNQQVLTMLGSIGTAENRDTYILNDGTYGIGVLRGSITGEYKARFIGRSSRLRYREEQMGILRAQLEAEQEILQELEQAQNTLMDRVKMLELEHQALPEGHSLHVKMQEIMDEKSRLERQQETIRELEVRIEEQTVKLRELLEKAQEIAETVYIDCRLQVFEQAVGELASYQESLTELRTIHAGYLQKLAEKRNAQEQMEHMDADMEDVRYELSRLEKRAHKEELELASIHEQLSLTKYEEIKEKLDECIGRLKAIPGEIEDCIKKEAESKNICSQNERFLKENEPELENIKELTVYTRDVLCRELALGYSEYEDLYDCQAENWEQKIRKAQSEIESVPREDTREQLAERLNENFYNNRSYLLEYQLNLMHAFAEDVRPKYENLLVKRIDISAKYRGETIGIGKLVLLLKEEIEDIQNLIKTGDKELFEDILANTIGRKIRNKINASMAWVEHMNGLMESMNTSSGLKLSLKWRSRTAETEDQLDTKELVGLLKKDARLMTEEEFNKLSLHFRSKVEQARRSTKESIQPMSFFAIMRDTLDYRKWFEFQLYFQKSGELKKELTNSCFGTFSGGEKAMSMYVPLFSAVVAKYQGGREDAPRIVSLDEAFAGVDNRNIRDMFRLMSEFEFNFIINSQVLWGDCDTLDGLAIYQLHRPNNQKFVAVMSFIWNGTERKSVREIIN